MLDADLLRVLTLQDYNTRIVVSGVTLLGLASGIIGSFMLLRKRSLLGDAVSHATLPGIATAFLVMTALGMDGKHLGGLLLGAVVSGGLGVGTILLLVHWTRLKEDAALGIVLSVFFGIGVCLLRLIQKLETGSAAGLESFVYGKTASMIASDAQLILASSIIITVFCGLLFKEFTVLCFDQQYAGAQGWPVVLLDVVLMVLVVGVTVVGLQAVGLILMVALLIIPAAAARFWTERLFGMVLGAAVLGGASCLIGALLSAVLPDTPAGAVIVLVASGFFLLSMLAGPARGIIGQTWRQWDLRQRVARQHLLRAVYELGGDEAHTDPVGFSDLLAKRSWSSRGLRQTIADAERGGLLVHGDNDTIRLTDPGRRDAWRVTRNHRLWELYLIEHADIAPSHVDRDADQIEHVLAPEMIAELEALLLDSAPDLRPPESPHALEGHR